jgi:hypothetical protein
MLAALTLAKLAAFGKTNWRIIAAVFLISTAYLYARHQGASGERKAEAARVVKATAKAAKVTTDLASSARKAGNDASASRERIVYRTRTIIQRIPQDVPTTANPVLGVGWVRNYADVLGLPEDPRLAGRAADQPYISAADALAGIDANNAECLKGWDAYRRVVGLYDQAAAKVNSFNPR